MKRCPDCDDLLPLESFAKNRNTRDGLTVYCKPHHNARGKQTLQQRGGAKRYHMRRRYGIDLPEYEALLAAQGGVCAICGAESPNHIDHDHATGKVRGILCFNCNGGLGQFHDDKSLLLSAVLYLDRKGGE